MREGGYVRYDGRKSTQVLRDCEMLVADYGGSLRRLHDTARDAKEVEQRLLDFHGIGLCHCEHFPARVTPVLGQRQSRSLALGREIGETPGNRPQPLQAQEHNIRQT